ncbi:SUMO-activating enzyme subunit 1-like [Zootermopsis nevadensis]|uniref:SUMO-activating enzyme subunit 1-like n=1 Tax=Zootermopsis nevadensis TaxID=136037 RepID=UPI000B8E5587|nr:SUMO-activating enzyme subunit 1-like [Zootermopsis nevadensis]
MMLHRHLRAEASLSRAQKLNPVVQVTADSEDVADKPDTFLETLMEVTVYKIASIQDCEEPAKKITKVDPVKVTTKRTATFVPLQDVLDVDWSSETYIKRLPKTDCSYFLIRVLLGFRSKRGHDPSPEKLQEDIKQLYSIHNEVLAKLEVPVDKVPDELFRIY